MNEKKFFQIRDAWESESSLVCDITLAAYEQYADIMPEALWQGYRRQILATLAEDHAAERIVAEQAGTLVGSVLLYPGQTNAYTGVRAEEGWPEVRLLAVLPGVRGQGVGSALIDECIQRARIMGATNLGLHTMDIMQAAMRLYEQKGFLRVPERDFTPTKELLVKAYRLDLEQR